MEETIRYYRPIWLGFIFLYSTCVLFAFPTNAQSNHLEPELSQLLDSAEILKLRGEYQKSIVLCNKVKTQAETTSDWTNYARAINELADNSRQLYDCEHSQEYLNYSRKIIYTHLDSLNSEMARYLYFRGKFCRDCGNSKDDNQDSVLIYYKKSEDILRQLAQYPKELASVLLASGNHHLKRGNIINAENYFKEVIKLLNENFDDLDYRRGWFLYYLGVFYLQNGDYERAILFTSLALHIFSNPSNSDKKRALMSEIMLANTFFDTNQFQSAFIHYDRSIEMAEENKEKNYSNLTLAYTNGGLALLEIDSIENSILFSKKALLLNRGEDWYDNIIKSYALLNLGLAFVEKKNYPDAEMYLDKSIKLILATAGAKDFYTHAIYKSIGKYYEKRGNFDKALEFYQKGLMALFTDFSNEDFYENPPYKDYENIEEILYVLTDKSGALYKRFLRDGKTKDLEAAYALYQTGYVLLENLLSSGYLDQSIIQVFQGFKKAFNLSIECAFELFNTTGEIEYFYQAFQFIEKSKYFLLLKAQMNSVYKQTSGISDSLFIYERQLTHDISVIKHELNNHIGDDTESSFSAKNKLMDKLVAKDELWQQINKESNLDISSLSDSLILTLEEIQNDLLENGETIIEYHWSDNFIYALSIGKNFTEVHKIEITTELLTYIDNYANAISGKSTNSNTLEGFITFVNSAHILYKKLFEPILLLSKNHLDNKSESNKITIVPDGLLSYLPFESLLTEIPDTSMVNYWGLPYLLNDYTIRYAYSLNILKSNLSARQITKKPKLLALSYSSEINSKSDIAQLRSENEIRYSAVELNKIKSWIKNGEFYEDGEATEEIFKTKASDFSLIHLAVHGQADITDMFNSKLIFKDDSTTNEDGELYDYELYNMDLSKVELAVLSACETGLGKQYEGEGIFSIARGFAYAGCPSIVMSLWKVNDKTTANLMDFFYKNLAEGMQKDEALQRAKLTFINTSTDMIAHPANWAAFITLGNNQPVHLTKSTFQWYYVLFLAGIITILVFIVRQKTFVKYFQH